MKLRELLSKINNGMSPIGRNENIPDDQTTDKVLRSLRRQRRVQLEEYEKESLRQQIMEHQRRRGREAIVGDGKTGVSASSVPTPFKKKPVGRSFLQRGNNL